MPRLTIGTGRALLGSNPDVAWVSLLQANATYAWTGASGLTLATWTDVKAGVVLTAAGTGTSIGTLAGRAAAVFNGSGRYAPAAEASLATQPYAVLAVVQLTGNLTATRLIYDARTTGAVVQHGYTQTTGTGVIAAGATLASAAAIATTAVHYATYNGASSSLRINGGEVAAGNAGSALIGRPVIGSSAAGTVPFIGAIADVIIVAGADYVARAAVIETAALVRYRI